MSQTEGYIVPATPHVIVAGYGVPGRAVTELLEQHGINHCIVERNPATVTRCNHVGVPIIAGDIIDEETMRQAHIETAWLLVLTVPDDTVAVVATAIARRLNPSIRVVTRCHYISAGLKAKQNGAEAVVVAEQVVATALTELLHSMIQSATDQ